MRRYLFWFCVVFALFAVIPASIQAQWIIELVDSTGTVGEHASLAVDGAGYPHISYYAYSTTSLKYAYRDTGGWNIEEPDAAGDVGQYTSLVLDDSGYAHISYYDNTTTLWDLKYVYEDSSGWHRERADMPGSAGKFTSLALDKAGFPYISYDKLVGMGDTDLRYAYKDGGGWHPETVDATGTAGQHTSLALDSNGFPHISYYELNNSDLKYARWTGLTWSLETVDSPGSVGSYTSLVLDQNGYPHISYHDEGGTNLKYAYRDAGGWNIETVDDVGDVGEFTSLALDLEGYPHISYYDRGNGGLKYAYLDSAGWHADTVESGPLPLDVGQYSSLALQNGRVPHIGYFDNFRKDLRYAYKIVTDVGMLSIDSPPDTVCPDSTYPVCVTVTNFGNVTSSFNAILNLELFAETLSVVDLLPGTNMAICFSDWTVPSVPDTSYRIVICTEMIDDKETGNDCLWKNVFAWGECAEYHDVGVSTIYSPQDTVCFDATYTPCALVENYGNRTETFDAVLTLDSYAETLLVADLVAGDDTMVCFSDWTVPFTSDTTYVMTFCAEVPGDTNLANGCAVESLFAHDCPFINCSITSSQSPPDTVCTDSTYPVCATIENFGNVISSFPVFLFLEASSETLQVDSLIPGEDTTVCFSDWTVPPVPDTTHEVLFQIELPGDEYPQDNRLNKYINTVLCVGIEEKDAGGFSPGFFTLRQNRPNPAVGQTEILYYLPQSSRVNLVVYDITGRTIRKLVDEPVEAGVHSVLWDGMNDAKEDLPPGVYFYKLMADPGSGTEPYNATRKAILLR